MRTERECRSLAWGPRLVLVVALMSCDASGARHETPQSDTARADAAATRVPRTAPDMDSVPQQSAPATGTTATFGIQPDTSVEHALDVLREYYAAIDAHDYARAYAAWGDDGPPGHPTRAEFAGGFASTDSVRLDAGEPGRIEGAAGSRYLAVPVTVTAFTRGGATTRYRGSYTLRRTVVAGASRASRAWHLYRASLRASTDRSTEHDQDQGRRYRARW